MPVVGDEGGALWSGLCKAKGEAIKKKTVRFFSYKARHPSTLEIL